MGSSNKYSKLHNKVAQRHGVSERLASLRAETLDEIKKFELDDSLPTISVETETGNGDG